MKLLSIRRERVTMICLALSSMVLACSSTKIPSKKIILESGPLESVLSQNLEEQKLISKKTFYRNNLLINSYLILDENKSWQELSEHIYGRNSEASLLQEINYVIKKTPLKGDIVYFNSPSEPFREGHLSSFNQKTIEAQTKQMSHTENLKSTQKKEVNIPFAKTFPMENNPQPQLVVKVNRPSSNKEAEYNLSVFYDNYSPGEKKQIKDIVRKPASSETIEANLEDSYSTLTVVYEDTPLNNVQENTRFELSTPSLEEDNYFKNVYYKHLESQATVANRIFLNEIEWPARVEKSSDKEKAPKQRKIASKGKVPSKTNQAFHTVQKGDSLWNLAKTYLSDSQRWKEFEKSNPALNLSKLKIGQKISIPSKLLENSSSKTEIHQVKISNSLKIIKESPKKQKPQDMSSNQSKLKATARAIAHKKAELQAKIQRRSSKINQSQRLNTKKRGISSVRKNKGHSLTNYLLILGLALMIGAIFGLFLLKPNEEEE